MFLKMIEETRFKIEEVQNVHVLSWVMALLQKVIGCMIHLSKRVVFSRDVIFNEQKYGLEESTQPEPKKYVYLEY